MKDRRYKLTVYAIMCITLLEIVALMKGIDGKVLCLAVGLLSGLAGLVIPSPIKKYCDK